MTADSTDPRDNQVGRPLGWFRRFSAGHVERSQLRKALDTTALLLVGYWILQWLWPAPAGVIVQGVILGALTAMMSLGVALVYRANRVINFAQADLGAVPAVLAVSMMVYRPGRYSFLEQGLPTGGLLYWLALPSAILSAIVLGALVERLVIRRFQKAPRLILMVVTIGLAQILAGLATVVPTLFFGGLGARFGVGQQFRAPFEFKFSLPPVVFGANHLLAVVGAVAVGLGLAALFRFTNIGVAIRACAENADRAAALGVNVGRTQTAVWMIAALLSAIAIFLRAGVVGIPFGVAFGPSMLMRALAAAAIGRMENYRVMFAASAALGVIETSILWHTRSTTLVDPVLFVIVLGALLLQRRGRESRVADQATSTWRETASVRPIPRELAHLPEVRWGLRALLALLIGGLVALPLVLNVGRTNLLAALFIFAILAVSLVILTGWAGEISLGQVAFFGIGAAVSGSLNVHYHWDLSLTVLSAGLAGIVAAVLIGLPALRIRGLFLTVTTLSFALVTSSYLLNRQHFSFLPDAFVQPIERLPLFGVADISSERTFYYLSLVVLGLTVLAARGLERSRTARVLIAARENPQAAQAFGVNLTRERLTAFAVSGFFASLAGGLFAIHQRALGEAVFAPVESIRALTMVVVGGLGSIPGALLGTVFVKSTEWFNFLVPSDFRFLFTFAGSGVGLVFVLLVLPNGLGSVLYRIRDRLLRMVADRRGLIVPSLIADKAQMAAGVGADLGATLVEAASFDASQGLAGPGDGNSARLRDRATLIRTKR